MRKTKIVCTIGPASCNEKTLEQMILAGMNVARINCSHGSHEEHQVKFDVLERIKSKIDIPVATMLDTKGPEYRIGIFKNGKEVLRDGDTFIFTTDDIVGDATRVSVSYKSLNKEINVGDTILVNNGLLIFDVKEISGTDIICEVEAGGEISDRKSISFPVKVLKQQYLSEQDKKDILFGLRNNIDYIACSFVSVRQDLIDVKEFLKANGGEDVSLIAKIENRSGIENIEEICKECDGIMIGRGDMGVEIPFEELPAIQKHLITKCRMIGKRVITATEMLESMIHNPRPTRAEISDVANAVYDGTSAIMLSGETAAGKFPVLAVKTMAKIAQTTEKSIEYKQRFINSEFHIKNDLDAISHAVVGMALDLNAKAIVVCSISGMTSRMVSRFRPPVNILGLSINEKTLRKLALSWGVVPALCEVYQSPEVLFYNAKLIAKEKLNLKKGDKIIITGGSNVGFSGQTNTIRVETI